MFLRERCVSKNLASGRKAIFVLSALGARCRVAREVKLCEGGGAYLGI